MISYCNYKDSGAPWLGEVPAHWRLERAKWHFSVRNERGNTEPVLLAATQKNGMYPQEKVEGVVKVADGTDIQQFKTVHKGDFVISLRSFQGGFERSDYEGVCSPVYQVFFADQTVWNNDYLKFLFKDVHFIDAMNALTVGIREGRNIKYEDFANSLKAIPPRAEQTAIAEYLLSRAQEIDNIISEAKASIEEYKAWKASIIYEAVTKGLDPNVKMKDSGIAWIGEIPINWACCKQKYVIKLINGRAYKDSEFEENGKYKILRVGNLFYNPTWYSSSLELDADKYCENGDLLYAWSMSYGPVIWTGEKVIYHYHIWKTKLSQKLDLRFTYYYLLALSNHIRAEAHATTMGFVTMETMNNSFIVFPELDKQIEIAAHLDEKCEQIDTIIADKESLISDLETYKKSLIFEVVTGKRRVC